jgi:hypothetical protein
MISETAGNGDQVSFVMSLRYIQKWIPAFAGMTSPFPDYGMITARAHTHTNTVSTRTKQNKRAGK